MSHEAWTDPPTGSGMQPCMVCDSPTQSHALRLAESESGEFEASTASELDFLFPVCHTCFMDHDGDAESVVAKLNGEQDPLIREAGLGPAILSTAGDYDKLDPTNRVKVVGEDSALQFIDRNVEPGVVIKVNDEGPFTVIPVKDEVTMEVGEELLYSFVEVEGQRAGGIVESVHPMDDAYYFAFTGPDKEMEFTSIESVEMLGENTEIADIDPVGEEALE